jgi:hypothetical protein
MPGRVRARPAAETSIHWHLIGPYLRPLHEQIDALVDAGVWAGVLAEAASLDGVPSPRLLAMDTTRLTVTSVQQGTDYAAIVVAGNLDRPALQQLRHHVQNALRTGVSHLVVDLSEAAPASDRLAMLLIRAGMVLQSVFSAVELAADPWCGASPATSLWEGRRSDPCPALLIVTNTPRPAKSQKLSSPTSRMTCRAPC